jgi:hypothetical protein
MNASELIAISWKAWWCREENGVIPPGDLEEVRYAARR